MAFLYHRTIRFQDTDAAGVVYFAQVLSLCHEAYEASLQQAGINLRVFFSRGEIAVPISHTEADFRYPLTCGDPITVELTPKQRSPDSFQIQYRVQLETGQVAAIATTRHVCIETATRRRCALTTPLIRWLQRWESAVAPPTDRVPPD